MSLPEQRIMKTETVVTRRHMQCHLLKPMTRLCRKYHPNFKFKVRNIQEHVQAL